MPIQIPQQTNEEVYQVFQRIKAELEKMNVPVFRDKKSLKGLQEGGRALHMDGGTLYTYVKCGGKLFRQEWAEV